MLECQTVWACGIWRSETRSIPWRATKFTGRGRQADKCTVTDAASCACVGPVSHQEARCTQHLGGRGIREGFIEERIREWSSDNWIQLPGEEMGWSLPSHPGTPPLLQLVCGPQETVALAAWSHLVYYFSAYLSLNYTIKGKDYYAFSISPFPSSITRAYL